MQREQNNCSMPSPADHSGRSAWRKPALVRLEAGAAESGPRQVIGDGPLSVLS